MGFDTEIRRIAVQKIEERRRTAEARAQARRNAFYQMLLASCSSYTYLVSYTGQWKLPSMEPYIREFWTHAPGALPLLIEIKSISGNLFLSIHRSTIEDRYCKAFLHQLEINGISYRMTQSAANDVAEFPMPATE